MRRGNWDTIAVPVDDAPAPDRARRHLAEVCGLTNAQAHLYVETVIDALVTPGPSEVLMTIQILRQSMPNSPDVIALDTIERLLRGLLGRG